MLPRSMWLVGCGNMGGAMLRRWIAAGMNPGSITVIDPGSPDVPDGVEVLADAGCASIHPDALVLAVKPQQLDAAEAVIRQGLRKAPKVLLSILAGVEEQSLLARFRETWAVAHVVRAMPNLPVAIGKGVTALYTSSDDEEARSMAQSLVAPLGHYEWIADEGLFDAVTALSGCGPGFVFRFVDALATAGAALGLPADQAQRLALATLEGSATMAAGADVSPATLADRVASPGGSTREGLNVLDEDDALVSLLTRTLAAAAKRNADMAAAAR